MAFVKQEWNADQFQKTEDARIEKAARAALFDCVAYAKLPPPTGTPRDTGALAGDIDMQPPRWNGNKLTGSFGSESRDYAFIVNLKNGYLQRAADAVLPRFGEILKRTR